MAGSTSERRVGARFGAGLIKAARDLRESYWFVPTTLAVSALLLAVATTFLDLYLGLDRLTIIGPPTQAEGARALMSIVAQSIFGVTGVMYSMTLVAVSYAAGQFGPRLIGNFMRDRVNQWSIGILVATFVYALVITRAIRDGSGEGAQAVAPFVPHVSIFVALFLTMICIGVVIYFIHHIPETINISTITATLGVRLIDQVKRLAEAQAETEGECFEPPDTDPDAIVTLDRAGYIQTLDSDALRGIARDQELNIAVAVPVGAFVSEDTAVLRVWGRTLPDDLKADLRACVALGSGPTDHQNLLFILDQLVEITARALSPGVNDPFTAIDCLNWMRAGAVAAANHSDGLTGRQEGRVHLRATRFADVLEAGFGASRPYTVTDTLCDRHVRELFDDMTDEIRPGPHRQALEQFLERHRDAEADPKAG